MLSDNFNLSFSWRGMNPSKERRRFRAWTMHAQSRKSTNWPGNGNPTKSSSEDALIHAVDVIGQKTEKITAILFLQATSPVRLSQDIDGAVELFLKDELDSLFSMAVLEDYCIWKNMESGLSSLTYDYKNRGRRQDKEDLYLENGSIYLFKPEILKRYRNRLGGKIGMYKMPMDRSYEIDSINDVEMCSYFMRKYYPEKK